MVTPVNPAQAVWNREAWQLTVLSFPGLPAGARTTALALAAVAGNNPEVAPGERRLGTIAKRSRSTVYYDLRRLEEAGLIERAPDPRRWNQAACYRLTFPGARA